MIITDKNSKRNPHLMKRPVARHLRVTIAFLCNKLIDISCVHFRKHAVKSACVIRAAIACLNYTGCIKKAYSWKILPNLTSAQNSPKFSVSFCTLWYI